MKNVVLPDFDKEELVSIPLDEEIYRATRSNLADIRLVNQDNEPVPFLIKRETETAETTTTAVIKPLKLSAEPPEDSRLVMTLELDEKSLGVNGIRLTSPLKDFHHRVEVFSSAEGTEWKKISDDGLIYDYSRHIDVRNDVVSFPLTDDKHFRIVIDQINPDQALSLRKLTRTLSGENETELSEQTTVQNRPFRVSEINFLRDTIKLLPTKNVLRDYQVDGLTINHSNDQQTTTLHFQTHRVPVTSLKLLTPERNFERNVTVKISRQQGLQTLWDTIATGSISHVDFEGLKKEDLEISIPETRSLEYQVIIHNKNDPALNFTGVVVAGATDEILAVVPKETSLSVLYGNPRAAPPQHHTQVIEGLFEKNYPRIAGELEPEVLREVTLAGSSLDALFNNWIFLGIVIFLLVDLLAVSLFFAMKRISALPAEDDVSSS